MSRHSAGVGTQCPPPPASPAPLQSRLAELEEQASSQSPAPKGVPLGPPPAGPRAQELGPLPPAPLPAVKRVASWSMASPFAATMAQQSAFPEGSEAGSTPRASSPARGQDRRQAQRTASQRPAKAGLPVLPDVPPERSG